MATTTTPSPKRHRREETRGRLLESALGVFARHGYDRATVDEIVREAGFSKGAFYVHFDSKDDLFWAMLEERINRQFGSFREALDSSLPVAKNLQSILASAFDLNSRDPLWSALFMEFAAHAARNERVRERLASMYQSWRSFAVEVLSAGREAGIVRKDVDVEFMATLLIAIVEGMMMQSRLSPEAIRVQDTVEPLARLLAEWLTP